MLDSKYIQIYCIKYHYAKRFRNNIDGDCMFYNLWPEWTESYGEKNLVWKKEISNEKFIPHKITSRSKVRSWTNFNPLRPQPSYYKVCGWPYDKTCKIRVIDAVHIRKWKYRKCHDTCKHFDNIRDENVTYNRKMKPRRMVSWFLCYCVNTIETWCCCSYSCV